MHDDTFTALATAAAPALDELAGALCAEVDSELFFPEQGARGSAAKRVCMACDVRVECLLGAIERREQWGIWGGLNVRERRDVAKRLGMALPEIPDDEMDLDDEQMSEVA